MLRSALLIKPSATFWQEAAHALLDNEQAIMPGSKAEAGWPSVRVVVPTLVHVWLLKAALAREIGRPFIPPRITTLSTWVDMLPPEPSHLSPQADSARLMSLYAELRQHGWLKKLFAARRNTDLLPLAQTLLTLSDELTQTLLPAVRLAPGAAEERWQAALAQLPPSARALLSDEAQLVWSIWRSQLDSNDACVIRYARMMRLAEQAEQPLVWITPSAPDAFHQSFLDAYAKRQPVQIIMLDWRAHSVVPAYANAWRELPETDASSCAGGDAGAMIDAIAAPSGVSPGVSIYAAKSLEDEAQCGAQTVIDWLVAGKSSIAVVAQDRVVARRIRALLERAKIFVADETGWKLSTTRAAAAVAAWFDVVASQAETIALLDLLKSPFMLADSADKPFLVMAIEGALRSRNISGGWNAVAAALEDSPEARDCILSLADRAMLFAERRTLPEWLALSGETLDALGMRPALENDPAGLQVIALLDEAAQHCRSLSQEFSFAEWRAFIGMQLEAAPFRPPERDRRVVMLPLNGARLRVFDAVLLVGADADHLPSRPNETLFFANAVRRELGLATREMLQRQQLRDFTELLCANPEVVLSWQSSRDGEPNPVSVWIERLQLALERHGANKLRSHEMRIAPARLVPAPPKKPAPAAPHLLPARLSASGYNSFVACPYQFFVTRMLGLSAMDELSDMPEKRDYGDWLHRILMTYHEKVRDRPTGIEAREALLRNISEDVFNDELEKNGAALAWYARWQKALPAYLAWANEREAAGWRFAFGEQWRETTLSWEGGQITLHGRIDRIDENEAGERAVLDYKTRNVQSLRDRLREGEDHQLAFYGLLSEAPVSCAHYVALEPARDKTGDAEAADFAQWQQALRERIQAGMQAVAGGAPLPASGIESVCRYCDVRGVCRKGAWL